METKGKIMVGNDCTGDLTKVVEYLDFMESTHDNWIKGRKGKFKICAKVFNEDSTYGIKDGRISKLQICDVSQQYWGFEQCYLNYDRGWDIRPTDPDAIEFVNGLLEAFGNDPLDSDDLLYYSLYTYNTEKDFDAGGRDHKSDFGTMEDALNEGRWYIDPAHETAGGTTCDFIKVISSDGEIEKILRRPESTDEERFATFTKELGELSTKHGVAIQSIGGVYIFKPGAVIEYDEDYTSGDLIYTTDGE